MRFESGTGRIDTGKGEHHHDTKNHRHGDMHGVAPDCAAGLVSLLGNRHMEKPEGHYPTPIDWVSASTMNKAGTWILYESNRRDYLDNASHDDIWLKDLLSDEERIVVEDAILLGWLDDETLGFRRMEQAGTFHIPSGELKTAHVTDGFIGVTRSHAVYATLNSVVIVHLDTNDEYEIKLPGATTVFSGTLYQPDEQAAVFYYDGSHESRKGDELGRERGRGLRGKKREEAHGIVMLHPDDAATSA